MFPVRKKKTKVSENIRPRKDGQLNVIMVMSDSISNSDAQRYLKKTYSMLKKNPDSVILEVSAIWHTTLFQRSYNVIWTIVSSPLSAGGGGSPKIFQKGAKFFADYTKGQIFFSGGSLRFLGELTQEETKLTL